MDILVISKTIQIILSILLIGLILLQGKGGGLSSTFGGSISFYKSKRGVEKVVFTTTVVTGVLLVLNSLLIIFLS